MRSVITVFCGLLAGSFTFSSLAQPAVKLNEVFANNISIPYLDGEIIDWVELYNTSDAEVDIGNASLTDDPAAPRKWVFPTGVKIAAKSFLTVLLDSSRPPSGNNVPPLNAGFGLKASGDRIYFHPVGGGTALDNIKFGLQAGDFPIGRVPDGSGAWVLTAPTLNKANVAAPLGSQTFLKVNEWMAAPASGSDWFEIYNPEPNPVSLSALVLTDTPSDPTAAFVITNLSFIGTGLSAYVRFWLDNDTDKGADHVDTFGLRAGGDSIYIRTARPTTIDSVTFGQQDNDVSQGRLPDGNATFAKFPNTPTPGAPNYLTFPGLVINEVLSHTDPPLEDAVEIYNTTDSPINIGGWFLSNKETDLKRYRVPDNTTVPAKGYFVFYEGQFNNAATALVPFTFNSAHGDQVYLAEAVNGQLTGRRIAESFEAAENGVSFGRYETSVPGESRFVAMSSLSFGSATATLEQFRQGKGAPNPAPKVGPIVINEIMYHPLSPDGVTDNTLDEYVELLNLTASPVLLYDPQFPQNTWRLRDGVTFRFPTGSSIPALSYALVVSFDPVQTPAYADAFRRKFGVPDHVRLFGPFTDKLGNGGEAVELYRPDMPQQPPRPDAGFVPYIRVDKVNYDDGAPWPTAAAGTGKSLQRKNATAFGNDPVNWEAANPTAGKSNSATVADADSDGMPDLWEDANGLQKNNAADAAQDPDADAMTNLQEYIAGTNPKNSSSLLRIEQVIPATATTPLKLRFTAVADKSYTVQRRNSLSPATAWEKLETVNAQPTTRVAEVQDTTAAGRTDRYYRVVTPAID